MLKILSKGVRQILPPSVCKQFKRLPQKYCLPTQPQSNYINTLQKSLSFTFSTFNNPNDGEQGGNWQPQSNPSSQGSGFFSRRTVMSDHFILEDSVIKELLQQYNINFKEGDKQIQIEWCPFCKRPHRQEVSNSYTLGIKKGNGAFHCFRCGIKGSWWDLKNLLYKNITIDEFMEYRESNLNTETKMNDSEFYLLHSQLLDPECYKEEKKYFTGKEDSYQRHIDLATLIKYKVGLGKEEFINNSGQKIEVPVIYFPMFCYNKPAEKVKDKKDSKISNIFKQEELSNIKNENSQSGEEKIEISNDIYSLVRCKVRGIGSQNKRYMRSKPSGQKRGIFGLNTVPQNAKQVVITEGEYDAMAVFQATGLYSISLPNGSSNIPDEIINCLEGFERIFLWLDNDSAGQNNVNKLASKLGIKRTLIIKTNGEKDANDILRNNPNLIKQYIERAKTIFDQDIIQYQDFKNAIWNRLNKYHENLGTQSLYMPFYNKSISGLRMGELTVLTGPTGSGKTSFLSQLSLDFCKQNVPTMWGSFEIKNEVLAAKMIQQFSGQDLTKNQEAYPFWSEQFEELPLYFMNFYGSTNPDQVIATIEYAIYKYGIQHVVIDNLQFLLGTQAKSFAKFDLMESTIEKLRKLATSQDINLTLVIHPKKVDENEDLNISSVFGSAKATQEADNVIIIQLREHYRVVEVKKNRFSGDMINAAVIFDRSNKNYYELCVEEVRQINEKKKKPIDIVKEKRKIHLQRLDDELKGASFHKKNPNGGDGNNNPEGNDGGHSSGGSSNPNNQGGSNNSNTQSNISTNSSNSFQQPKAQSGKSNQNINDKKYEQSQSTNQQQIQEALKQDSIGSQKPQQVNQSQEHQDANESISQTQNEASVLSDSVEQPTSTEVKKEETNIKLSSQNSQEQLFEEQEQFKEADQLRRQEPQDISELHNQNQEIESLGDIMKLMIEEEANKNLHSSTIQKEQTNLFQETQKEPEGLFSNVEEEKSLFQRFPKETVGLFSNQKEENLFQRTAKEPVGLFASVSDENLKKKKSKEEVFDTDPIEPIDFDIYGKVKSVPKTETFFKSKNPIPENQLLKYLGKKFSEGQRYDDGLNIIEQQQRPRFQKKKKSDAEICSKFQDKE